MLTKLSNPFNPIRYLAKSIKWQILYSRSKEVGGIQLFKNQNDFTAIQVMFLQWLEIYHGLELDLSMKEPMISREVIDDDIRCDAYLKARPSIQKAKDKKKDKSGGKENREVDNQHVPSVIFNKGK